jgi:hypothetical protein
MSHSVSQFKLWEKQPGLLPCKNMGQATDEEVCFYIRDVPMVC